MQTNVGIGNSIAVGLSMPRPSVARGLMDGAGDRDQYADGRLTKARARPLLAKLEALDGQLDQLKTTPAENLMCVVIAEVKALANSGRLTAEEVQPLIEIALREIEAL